jgi:hypothetical protein
MSQGAQTGARHGIGLFDAIPYRGDALRPLRESHAGLTIPLATFTTVASKDGLSYADTLVGADPSSAAKGATFVNVLIVPLNVQIGATDFNPVASDRCIPNNLTPLAALEGSPLLKPVIFDGSPHVGHGPLVNGVDPGITTYLDAFRRAEFWSLVQNTQYHTELKVTVHPAYTVTAAAVTSLGGGNVLATGCAPLGVLPTAAFRSYLENTVIPAITVIRPDSFVLFLTKDVVTTSSSALDCSNGCTIGYHAAIGSPVQTYGVADYDTTFDFWNNPGITDISVLAHELAEWLDDPLVTNPTPAWGNIGQVSGCQTNAEVGDALTGTDDPAIPMLNGLVYHPQELVFHSWFYNANGVASLGAGGKFSMNGSFNGPSAPCPPGGSY